MPECLSLYPETAGFRIGATLHRHVAILSYEKAEGMNAQLSPSTTESPAETIARIESAGKRIDTPCGDGSIVWHQWGNAGPWLFLLHGNFGSWKHWIRNVETLGQQYRVVAVDIPGFGESAEPNKPYSAHSLADVMVKGIRSIVGDEQINLAGFSFGGAVSSELAYVLGEQVKKLVWVSSGRNTGMSRGKLEPFVKWREMKTREEREAAHRRNLEVIMIAEPSRVDALAVHIQSTNAEQARLRSAIIGEAASTKVRMTQIPCEVAAIWADRDATIGPHMAERPLWLETNRPGSRWGMVHDAGHWCAYEQPEAFNRVFLDLLGPKK